MGSVSPRSQDHLRWGRTWQVYGAPGHQDTEPRPRHRTHVQPSLPGVHRLHQRAPASQVAGTQAQGIPSYQHS